MVKKTVTYTDFDGNEVTKDFYFNINKMEFRELDRKIAGGLERMIESIRTEKDSDRLLDLMNLLILEAYGEISEDGRFVKEDARGRRLSSYFKISEAWDVLFTNLLQNENELNEFLAGIVPKDIAESAREYAEKEKNGLNGGEVSTAGKLTPLSQK